MGIESTVRKAKKALREMDSQDQRTLGTIAGIIAGEIANRAYRNQTQDGKEQWERARLMHHGDAGYLLREFKREDPFYEGLGEGLMVSDLGDKDKCFYPGLGQTKRKRKRKT